MSEFAALFVVKIRTKTETIAGNLFRGIVLNAIGRIEDGIVTHKFVLCDLPDLETDSNTAFLEYVTSSDIPEHQYQASVKVRMSNADKEMLKKFQEISQRKGMPVMFEAISGVSGKNDPVQLNLYNLLHGKDMDVMMKFIGDSKGNIVTFQIIDLARFQRLDMSSTVVYPTKQKYFIYGDENQTIMSHVMTSLPDYQQAVRLLKRPDYLSEQMLQLGVVAEIEGVEGREEGEEGARVPQKGERYYVTFTGELNAVSRTSIEVKESVYLNYVKKEQNNGGEE